MTKEELMKYAEQGVRDELAQMQLKINNLARLFPHIVCHADGTVPSIGPVVLKKENRGGDRQTPVARMKRDERLAQVRQFLQDHPGKTSAEVAAALNLSKAGAHKFIHDAGAVPASPHRRGSRTAIQWKLGPVKTRKGNQ